MDENKMPENDGWKKNARLAIYAMAGFYLLTLAYQMFRAISTSHGNEQLVMIVATILFLIVGVGFIVGVIQDSCETGLNSSSDVVFTATAEYRQLIKEGKEVHLGKDSFAYHELS